MPPWLTSGVVTAFISLCVYYNSLDAGFVYDDSRVILSNPDILPSSPLENVFNNDFWGTPLKSASSHGSYRPLCILTYRLNYLWAGFNPFSYHLVNIILHSLCTCLVHLLATWILPNQSASWVASGLFAVHPVHTEAVAGLVGRADILSAIFLLLAVLVFLHLPSRSLLRYVSVTFLGACAMLSKEIGVSAVLICIVWDVTSRRGSNTNKPRKSWSAFILLSLSFITLLCVRIMMMGDSTPSFSKADNPTARHPSFVTRTLTFLYLPLLNMKLLLYPQQLSYDWGMEAIQPIQNIYDARNLLTISFYSVMFYTTVRLANSLLKNSRQNKMSKPMTGKTHNVCDNLEVMCNYCKYRRCNGEASQKKGKVDVDFNNNDIADESVLFNINFTKQASPIEQASAVDRKQWNSDCFHYESVIEIYVKKVCLALMSVYMYSAHNDYGNSPFKRRRSKIMINGFETVHGQLCKNCDVEAKSPGRPDTGALDGIKTKIDIRKKVATHENAGKSEKKNMKSKSDANSLSKVNLKSAESIKKCTCSKLPPLSSSKLKHEERLLVMLALLVIPCIPASNLFFYVGFVLAERVLYIPSIGFCYLVAYGYCCLHVRMKDRKTLLNAAVVFLMLIYSLKTIRRNLDWRDEESLYRSGIVVNPPKSYGNLGSILSSQGRFTEAEEAYRMALSFRPNMADVHYNLGILLQGQDRTEEAIVSYKNAIFYRPSLASAYLNLGQLLASIGQCDVAATILRQCAELDGKGLKDPRTHESARISALLHLGRLHADRKRYAEAVAVYKEALQRRPPYYQPSVLYSMLGEALAQLSRPQDAEAMYRAALKAQPDHVASHLTYGKLLAKNRTRLAEAELWFRKAQKLAPADPNVYQHYGQFLSELGRYLEAAPLYIRATQLSPSDYDCTLGAATALRHSNRLEEAEEYYRRAATLRPLDAGSHSNLGAILHLNRKYSEAESSYTESIRLQPNDITARDNLRKLRALKSLNRS